MPYFSIRAGSVEVEVGGVGACEECGILRDEGKRGAEAGEGDGGNTHATTIMHPLFVLESSHTSGSHGTALTKPVSGSICMGQRRGCSSTRRKSG